MDCRLGGAYELAEVVLLSWSKLNLCELELDRIDAFPGDFVLSAGVWERDGCCGCCVTAQAGLYVSYGVSATSLASFSEDGDVARGGLDTGGVDLGTAATEYGHMVRVD